MLANNDTLYRIAMNNTQKFRELKTSLNFNLNINKIKCSNFMELVNHDANVTNSFDKHAHTHTPSYLLTDPLTQLEDLVVNSDDLAFVPVETSNGQCSLKLERFDLDQLPRVSIVTITSNRRKMFSMPIRNFIETKYPSELLEWVIIDTSTSSSEDLDDILPNDDRILYIKYRSDLTDKQDREDKPDQAPRFCKIEIRLAPTNRMAIGNLRNLGVEAATGEIIVFFDDDDYYYPLSVYARVASLLSYPKYSCVGVVNVEVFNTLNESCAVYQSPYLSEASMGFWRSFWLEGQFPENDFVNNLGEGEAFTRGRRNKLIVIPSSFNLIAMTHHSNVTGGRRHITNNTKLKLLSQLSLETKLFILKGGPIPPFEPPANGRENHTRT